MHAPVTTPGSRSLRPQERLRVGLVLGGFPSEKAAAFKYFLLLLNRLQETFEFEFYDSPADDPLVRILGSKKPVDAETVREMLPTFATSLKRSVDRVIRDFDLAASWPTQ